MNPYYLEYKIVAETIEKNRKYVILEMLDGKQKKIKKMHFVWLKANPAFQEIPKGYVIHHLDVDPLNDDPSNLALMEKHQHTAHHWKQKVVFPEIKIRDKKPVSTMVILNGANIHVYKGSGRGYWYLQWYQDGIQNRLFKWSGSKLDNEERAREAKECFDSATKPLMLTKEGFVISKT